jgi:predicted nucleotidyltransferase
MEGELRAAGVAKLWLFGSVARGEPDAKDLDFLVDFTSPPTLISFMNLKFLLEERLQMPVDLLTRSSCPDRFMRRIQSEMLHVA